jgi:peptidyl-prolyl cis-trans isomerase C
MHCGVLSLSLLLPVVLPASVAPLVDAQGTTGGTVLVTVNGRDITQSDLDAEYLSRQVPDAARETLRERLIEDLIDRALLAAFLQKLQVSAPERELELQMSILRRAAGQSDEEFVGALSRLGLTEASLREHLALPLAWRSYVRQTVSEEQLRQHFERHQAEFDGTEVRASQIVIGTPAAADEAAWSAAEQRVTDIRSEIAAGKVSFADAARRHSSSPSGRDGGDLGFFAYRGRLPVSISSVAFSLQPGEISRPFRTAFGVHLVTVTERRAGDLSLEDVRGAVLDQISRELWEKHVETERKTARIQRREPMAGTESR